jgi:hypothetical protein
MKSVIVEGEVKTYKRGRTMSEYTPWMKAVDNEAISVDPVVNYMNREDVRRALNIPKELGGFNLCLGDTL